MEDYYKTKAVRMVHKAMEKRRLSFEEAQDLMEIFDDDMKQFSPSHAYNNFEIDLEEILAKNV
jgi:hypothetical protein